MRALLKSLSIAQMNKDSKEIRYIDNYDDQSKEFRYIDNND